jgi:seryl-tRNA synthetase
MHDIKFIRQTPDAFDAGLARRGLEPIAKNILEWDESERKRKTELQELQSKSNQLAKAIGMARGKGEDVAQLLEESKLFKEQLHQLEIELDVVNAGKSILATTLESLPNLPANDVPLGKDERDNVELRVVGTKPSFNFSPKLHDDLGVALGLMDFDGAAKLSGSRFVVLKGALARMERALANFMLDIHTTEFGFTEHVPPALVRDEAVYGTGQLPKFAEDLFRTENGYWLIPTAEVPLTNLVADSIVDEEKLPIRMTAYTPCFRSEAGAAGKDTRGMIRQHQFSKVELVSVVHPDKSEEEHERMTSAAEEVLKRLGLHYRVIVLCTGDMGFCSQKTYDIEVWMPGQDAFREISSCSNCGPFQARRMKARFKAKGAKETQFLHTLNGSGLAIGRTMVAILENYQNADGSITVPEALRPYMGGLEVIR